ncbi:hypothetical protein BU105_02155 [Staphylococcus xylosus]|nr:hypothetical protein BU105_02155 [Staphylococcus xylosus]
MIKQRCDEIQFIRVKKDEFEAFKKHSSLSFLKGFQATFPEQNIQKILHQSHQNKIIMSRFIQIILIFICIY